MRKKKREPILHQTDNSEIFRCLSAYPHWGKFMLGRGKIYEPFLLKLLSNNFYCDREERVSFKQIGIDMGYKVSDVTKWISKIYYDLYELNETEPLLFKSEGIRHEISFKYFDTYGGFTLWLPQTPRIYDHFSFQFIQAIVGTYQFWVKDVHHQVNDGEYKVMISLRGNERNIYREWLVDRGLFTGRLHFMDVYQKDQFEIDKILLEWYRD